MLILTRKPGESLYIGDVKVTIVELKGHQIRIGIDAPPEIRIYREEIYVQILEENRKAAEAAASTPTGLEGLPNWSPPSSNEGGSDDGKPKKPTFSGLSAFSTSVFSNTGGAAGLKKESNPDVVIRKKRKHVPEQDEK